MCGEWLEGDYHAEGQWCTGGGWLLAPGEVRRVLAGSTLTSSTSTLLLIAV